MQFEKALLDKAQLQLDKAVFTLLGNKQNTFINSIYFRTKKKWDACGTAYTDGLTIGIDPKFFTELKTDKLRVFVLAHEIWHIALRHMIRFNQYPKKYWNLCNVAADEVINNMLKRMGYEIWSEAYCTPEYADKSFEQVMEILLQKQKNNQPITLFTSAMGTDVRQPGSGSPKPQDQKPESNPNSLFASLPEIPKEVETPVSDPKELEDKINSIVVQAAITAQQAGYSLKDIAPELAFEVNQILNPKISWRALTNQFMLNCNHGSMSYAKPRKTNPDFILPTLTQDRIALVTIYFDVSGSILQGILKQFYSDLVGLKSQIDIEKIVVKTFNTRLRETITFDGDDTPILNIKIGGGTNIFPVLEDLNKEDPNIAIIFTDGEFEQPTKPWNGNLLWVSSTQWKAPFGTTVHI